MSNNGQPKDTIRLTLSLSPEMYEKLEQLATSAHTSKSEVMRRSLGIYDIAVEGKGEGYYLGLTKDRSRLEREIVNY